MRIAMTLAAILLVTVGCSPTVPSVPVATPAVQSVAASPVATVPTTRAAPLSGLEVRCDTEGNRPGLTCDELTSMALAAVVGLPWRARAVGLSAYGFPCGTPIPQAAVEEGCVRDVDDGPVGWVRFAGTDTIVALRFTIEADGVHASVAATGRTPMSVAMLVEASNPPSTAAPLPTQPPAPGAPTLRLASGEQLEPAMRGGCGSVLFETVGVAADQCGPSLLDPAIVVAATRVGRGDSLVLVAPAAWRFGTDPALAQRWFVRVARSSAVAGAEETQGTLPDGIGRTVRTGTTARGTIRLSAPSTPGDYLLQFDGGLSRDGWSITEGTWYWHIRVR